MQSVRELSFLSVCGGGQKFLSQSKGRPNFYRVHAGGGQNFFLGPLSTVQQEIIIMFEPILVCGKYVVHH